VTCGEHIGRSERTATSFLRSDESGFALIDLIAATVIFLVIASPLLAVTTAAMSANKLSRQRTRAEQIADGQMDKVRALDYGSVGLPNGNPSGTLPASTTINEPDLQATMTIQASYVNDPVPNSYVTYADYKKVTVTITSTSGKVLARDVTYVAPPGHGTYGPVSQAVIKVQVMDMGSNTVIPGATVSLATGPDAPRSDTTDGSGTVIFPDLTPNPTSGSQQYYDVTASASGYTALSDDLPPSTTAHVQLATSQQFSTILRLYKAATLNVTINSASGGLYTGAATVTVASSRKAQSFSVTGGTLQVTSLNGEPLVPNLTYTVSANTAAGNFAPVVSKVVPDNYPTVLTSAVTVVMSSSAYTLKTLTITVKNSGGTAVSGARVDVTGGPVPILLTATTNSSGVATFNVPSGTNYTATATSGTLTGSWTGSVTAATSQTVTVH